MKDPEKFAFAQLDRLQGFFGRIEAKASFLFAVNLGLLGFALANTPLSQLCSLRGICSVITEALLALSMAMLYRVVVPHLRNAGQPSLLYFSDVSHLKMSDFSARIKAITPDELVEDALCQVWRNSEILRRKFEHTRSAFSFTAAALPFWLGGLMMTAAHDGKFPSFH
jgi:hypothetical protein